MSTKGLSGTEVEVLKAAGYSVQTMYDGDPELYGWVSRYGASQAELKHRQPYRRTVAQAWFDCNAYHEGGVPTVAEPDWTHE